MSERGKDRIFAAALAFLFLYSFPYFPGIRSANELPRVYLTQAMVEEGTFAIDTGVRRWGKTADMSPSGGRLYSNKAPGSSLAAVPGYLVLKGVKAAGGSEPTLAEMMWTSRVTTGVLPTLLFLVLLFRFLGRYTESREVRRLVVAGYALGTMAMTYSVLFIAHQLAAVCIFSGFIFTVWVLEDGRDRRWMLLAGLLAGAAPLVDYQAAFAGVPVAVYALVRMWKQRTWSPAAYAAAGAAVPIAVLLLYHWSAFGSPFTTGYDASETFAHFHQRGFLGLDRFRIEALLGSTVRPDNGLLLFSPLLLWAFLGWELMVYRGSKAHAFVTLAVVAIYILFISSVVFWRGGWQMGPRYITAMLPFAVVPVTVAAAWADDKPWARWLVVGAAGVGMFIYGISCALFPHFPEKFANPLYELVLRLLADGHAPYNAGWLVGLRGVASLVPYLSVLFGVIVWVSIPGRHRWVSGLAGLVAAAGVLWLYHLFPGGGATADAAYDWVVGVFP